MRNAQGQLEVFHVNGQNADNSLLLAQDDKILIPLDAFKGGGCKRQKP